MIDPYERIVALSQSGIYESNYLKANSPDGKRAVWLKHNLLRPLDRPAKAELWAVVFERYREPRVARRDVPWAELQLSGSEVSFRASDVELHRGAARGRIADMSWDLKLSRGQAPIFHFRHPGLYTNGVFPKKKILTPAPNLHFDGRIDVDGEVWEVDDWVGLRGHNWGSQHAHSYAFGAVNLWDDGDTTRTVDGFTARVRVGRGLTPWCSSVVARNPPVRNNGIRHWLTRASVKPGQWSVGWSRLHRGALQLEMAAPPEHFVGLRYEHPDGTESACYNTKFASVVFQARGETHTSRCGELELLFPHPLDGIALHPTPGWTQSDGDYRSG